MTSDVIIIDDDEEDPSTIGPNAQLRDDDVVYVVGGGESSTTRGDETNLDASNNDVALLQSFGFSNREATNALQLCKGNKDAAAIYLFDGILPPNADNATSSHNRVDTENQSQHSLKNQLVFLLEDPDFYQACYHANRYDRDTASKAILECLTRLSETKPEFMQIIAANPLELIQLISSIEL